MENEFCKHCGKPLSMSVYSKDGKYKSCPCCSEQNGNYHVFHRCPNDYGTTNKRSTSVHPEGIQSYCVDCRGQNPPQKGILCCDIEQ